jgi:hypothetical protein
MPALPANEFVLWLAGTGFAGGKMFMDAFIRQCIYDIHDGLRNGLTLFSRPTRAALIIAPEPDQPLFIYDPRNLLHGHEPKFEELYLDSTEWRRHARSSLIPSCDYIQPDDKLELAGLISYGCRSRPVFYQRWFTEHHPDMCSIGPTERWLEHAAWRLSHDLANKSELYTGISGHFLREFATHAVRDYIIDKMNMTIGWDSHIRVFPILESVLGISKTLEEGEWPRGELLFVEPSALSLVNFVARFPEEKRPAIDNFKHVRKLLQCVQGSQRRLVSDGTSLTGIAVGNGAGFSIVADFRGSHGFLSAGDELICSFADGSYHSSTLRAKMVQLEEALIESRLDAHRASQLFKIAAAIVHNGEKQKHGCTVVLDLNASPVQLPGHRLEKPLNLQEGDMLELAMALTRMDGAIHIGADLHLHGFACLLDGLAIRGEDGSRGARYNSALRFTAANRNIIVVVLSSDRPVSIIQEGIELSAQCAWVPVAGSIARLPTLEEWVQEEKIDA